MDAKRGNPRKLVEISPISIDAVPYWIAAGIDSVFNKGQTSGKSNPTRYGGVFVQIYSSVKQRYAAHRVSDFHIDHKPFIGHSCVVSNLMMRSRDGYCRESLKNSWLPKNLSLSCIFARLFRYRQSRNLFSIFFLNSPRIWWIENKLFIDFEKSCRGQRDCSGDEFKTALKRNLKEFYLKGLRDFWNFHGNKIQNEVKCPKFDLFFNSTGRIIYLIFNFFLVNFHEFLAFYLLFTKWLN